jgi:hypothetical protein
VSHPTDRTEIGVHFLVEILRVDDEPPRDTRLLMTYQVRSSSIEGARIAGLSRFEHEHPRDSMAHIYAKATPAAPAR